MNTVRVGTLRSLFTPYLYGDHVRKNSVVFYLKAPIKDIKLMKIYKQREKIKEMFMLLRKFSQIF